MCSLINKQLLLTAYAYLFIMEQQGARQGSESLQLQLKGGSKKDKLGQKFVEAAQDDLQELGRQLSGRSGDAKKELQSKVLALRSKIQVQWPEYRALIRSLERVDPNPKPTTDQWTTCFWSTKTPGLAMKKLTDAVAKAAFQHHLKALGDGKVRKALANIFFIPTGNDLANWFASQTSWHKTKVRQILIQAAVAEAFKKSRCPHLKLKLQGIQEIYGLELASPIIARKQIRDILGRDKNLPTQADIRSILVSKLNPQTTNAIIAEEKDAKDARKEIRSILKGLGDANAATLAEKYSHPTVQRIKGIIEEESVSAFGTLKQNNRVSQTDWTGIAAWLRDMTPNEYSQVSNSIKRPELRKAADEVRGMYNDAAFYSLVGKLKEGCVDLEELYIINEAVVAELSIRRRMRVV